MITFFLRRGRERARMALRARVLLVSLGVCAANLVGPLAVTASASSGCTAIGGSAPIAMVSTWASIQVHQAFTAGEQFTITLSSYTNTGGPGTKTINLGQGNFMGNANSGGFGSFTLAAPGTFGPFTVPSGGITQLSMSVAGGQGTMTVSGSLTCLTAPTVATVTPTVGPSAGGTGVTIIGTGFTGTTAVTIGGLPATGISVIDAGTITAITPAHAAGTVDVVVTNSIGAGTGGGVYTYAPVPTVTATSPASGTTAGGTALTITGTGFTGTTAVTIGGLAATGITVVSATTIMAAAPAHPAGVADVSVTTPGGTGTGSALYTYAAGPTVSGIAPASGATAGGASVTITGTGFTGATAVTIGGLAATGVTVVNATTITAIAASHAAGSVDVVVTTPFGTATGGGLYTYVAGPTLTTISPGNGSIAGGTAVTITGANFTGATSVTFDGTAATSLTVVNATTITATTPVHAAGAVDVSVTTPFGTGTKTGLYGYVAGPAVTAMSPAAGAIEGGTAVTITGTDFTGATVVAFGGATATDITVVNATTITATTPAHAAGFADVTITTPGGSVSGAGIFRYAAAPAVSAISPSNGPIAGGTAVMITGTDFTGATAVTVGGRAATGITVVNANTITATTAAHASGPATVVVSTAAGTGTGVGIYAYVAAPALTTVVPSTGPVEGGTKITITGANLTAATAVTVGGVAASGITIVDSFTIVVTTPAHAAGPMDIVVMSPGGTGTGAGLYTYLAELTLVSTSPASTQVGKPYSQANVASGGTPPYSYALSAGRLPEGTSLDPSTGLVSGNPVTSGAFSYTVTVADSGPTVLTTSKVVSGSIAPTMTMTSLASSMNPSLTGEQVTFTATVTPAASAGSVTFTDGSATLCSGVALASGAASCTLAFVTSGAHAIAAEYSGSSALGASTSAVLVQTVTDQRLRTIETIGRFMSRRNDLIAASEPDMNRQIGRLMALDAGGAASSGRITNGSESGANVSNGAPILSSPTGYDGHEANVRRIAIRPREGGPAFGRDDRNSMSGSDANRGSTTYAGGTMAAGPVRVAGTLDGPMHFGFGTSLRQVTRPQGFSPIDVWVEGKYESFSDDRGDADLDGHFGIVSIGADYVPDRKVLVGAAVQFDTMRQHSHLQTSEASGHGWMAGPYATVRLVDSLFLQGRAAWGGSTNAVRPYQTYTDEFSTGRWLVSSTLTGRWALASWTVRPSASVAYIEDAAKSYSDAFGVVIPEVSSRLGQARVGPEIGYRHQFGSGMVLEPRAGLQLISNFAGDTTAGGFGRIIGGNAGPVGLRGRTELGVRMSTFRGIAVDLSGSYDGIGASNYPALGGQMMVQVPPK